MAHCGYEARLTIRRFASACAVTGSLVLQDEDGRGEEKGALAEDELEESTRPGNAGLAHRRILNGS